MFVRIRHTPADYESVNMILVIIKINLIINHHLPGCPCSPRLIISNVSASCSPPLAAATWCRIQSMSSPPSTSTSTKSIWLYQEKPTYVRVCDGCTDLLPWWRLSLQKKPQFIGRWYTSCRKSFKWAPGSAAEVARASQSASPDPSQPALSPVLPPATPTLLAAAIVPLHDGVTICNVVGCNCTRIHSKCSQKCCRKHCCALGGCEANSHDPDDVLNDTLELRNPPPPLIEELPPPPPPPPPSLPVPDSPPPPAVMLKGKGKSRAIPQPVAGPSKPQHFAGDAEDPRYAIHLKPIFTEAYAEEEANDLHERKLEKEQHEAAECAKHQVMLYVWTANGVEPDIHKLQQGFKFPNFFLTAEILHKLGLLTHEGDASLTLQHYNHKRRLWTSFDVGHMVKLHDNNLTIFLKDLLVTHCIDLERHLQQSRLSPVPNLFTNLADERKAVKAAQKSHAGHTPFNNDDVLELSSTDEADEPPVPAVSRSSDLEGGTFSDPIDVDEQHIWPVDFYACDIEAGFQKCLSATRARRSVPMTFTKHFGVHFIKTTYYDHRRHWMEEVDVKVCEHYISYGRTSKGLWSSFLQELRKKQK
ncbi:hypothetical protein BDR03DRAFT_981529 [Suillus americanus]|nr:hypothetical protein BDR03DRAFT_981529 [Suillus americanus]